MLDGIGRREEGKREVEVEDRIGGAGFKKAHTSEGGSQLHFLDYLSPPLREFD